MHSLGKEIRRVRDHQKVAPKRHALLADIKLPRYYLICSGRAAPSDKELERMAKSLNQRPEDVVLAWAKKLGEAN